MSTTSRNERSSSIDTKPHPNVPAKKIQDTAKPSCDTKSSGAMGKTVKTNETKKEFIPSFSDVLTNSLKLANCNGTHSDSNKHSESGYSNKSGPHTHYSRHTGNNQQANTGTIVKEECSNSKNNNICFTQSHNFHSATFNNPIPQWEQKCKLFIGGIPMSTTETVLKHYFSKYGEVVDAVVMKDRATGRSRGFGFVTFREPLMLDAAQSGRPHEIEGKQVETKRAMPREDSTNPESHITVHKLLLNGVTDQTEADMKEYFSQFGNITECLLDAANQTATITFDDYDSVDKVILHGPHSIGATKVEVRKALNREQQAEAKQRQLHLNASRPQVSGRMFKQNTSQSQDPNTLAAAVMSAAVQLAMNQPNLFPLGNAAGTPGNGASSHGNAAAFSFPAGAYDISNWSTALSLAALQLYPYAANSYGLLNPTQTYNGYTENGAWIPPAAACLYNTGPNGAWPAQPMTPLEPVAGHLSTPLTTESSTPHMPMGSLYLDAYAGFYYPGPVPLPGYATTATIASTTNATVASAASTTVGAASVPYTITTTYQSGDGLSSNKIQKNNGIHINGDATDDNGIEDASAQSSEDNHENVDDVVHSVAVSGNDPRAPSLLPIHTVTTDMEKRLSLKE